MLLSLSLAFSGWYCCCCWGGVLAHLDLMVMFGVFRDDELLTFFPGIESPGLTSSMALGDLVAALAGA